MNKEEIKHLSQSYYDLHEKYYKLQQENEQLKDNWNKLKKCLKDVMNSSDDDDKDFIETILDIMQELEQESDSNE